MLLVVRYLAVCVVAEALFKEGFFFPHIFSVLFVCFTKNISSVLSFFFSFFFLKLTLVRLV